MFPTMQKGANMRFGISMHDDMNMILSIQLSDSDMKYFI